MNLSRPLACALWLATLSACGDDDPPPPSFTELDSQVATAMEAMHLPGVAVCAAKGDRVLFCRHYGKANLETGQPMTEHTPMMLASIAKAITAVTTVSLVERGKLDLDTPVVNLVDFEMGHPRAASVTPRHLLTHTSAITDNPALGQTFYEVGRDSAIPLAEVVRGYLSPTGPFFDVSANFLPHTPGSAWSYSNQGYSLLGRIGEIAGGAPFHEQCRRTVFTPLGLSKTSMRLGDLKLADMAIPYRWNGTGYDTHGVYTIADYPNGGLFSSAYDIVRFAAAIGDADLLESRGVLDKSSRDTLLTPFIRTPNGESNQALGFVHSTLGTEPVYAHNGAEWGVMAMMDIRVKDGLAAVFLTNSGVTESVEPAYKVMETLFETGSRIDTSR